MRFISFLFFLFLCVSCDDDGQTPSPIQDLNSLSMELQRDLNDYVHNFAEIPGALLQLQLPGEEPIQLAAGQSGFGNERPLQTDDLFRTSSISKIFTAVIILQLMEEDLLQLEDRLIDFLPEQDLLGLHQIDGENMLPQVNLQHLLNHRSGIDNYVELDWVPTLIQEPSRFWTPWDLIDYTRQRGSAKHIPGSAYFYSDLNYVLLGLVAESVTNQPLHELYRARIYTPLNLQNTYLEAYESVAATVRIHGYFDNTDLLEWSSSSDWGGGGILSNTSDLSAFITALMGGQLLEEPSSLALMQDWMSIGPRAEYGLGVGRYEILPNHSLVGHSGQGFGFTSGLYFWPEHNMTIVLAVNQQNTDLSGFEMAVLSHLVAHFE